MSSRVSTHFALTAKGVEELALRTHRLDNRLRNILFLIQKGTPTIEAILQNSIFPHEEVIEKLRGLLKERFVELVAGLTPAPAPSRSQATRADATPSETAEIARGPTTVGAPPPRQAAPTLFPRLDSGISMSQARFVLCDFCLDQFGANAQPLLAAIEEATDVDGLQRVLDAVTTEVRRRFNDQLPALMAKVREINDPGA